MTATAVAPPAPAPAPGEPDSPAQAVQRVEQLIRQFYGSYQLNRRWYQFSSTFQLILAAAIPVYAVVTPADSLNYKIVAACCGAMIAIVKGVQESYGIYQNWVRQAQVYKELQCELDMFNARAGDYSTGSPLQLLITRATKYVMDENKAWADSAKQPPAENGG